jgi:hypothetical protein
MRRPQCLGTTERRFEGVIDKQGRMPADPRY